MIEVKALTSNNITLIREISSMLAEAFPHSWQSIDEGIIENYKIIHLNSTKSKDIKLLEFFQMQMELENRTFGWQKD